MKSAEPSRGRSSSSSRRGLKPYTWAYEETCININFGLEFKHPAASLAPLYRSTVKVKRLGCKNYFGPTSQPDHAAPMYFCIRSCYVPTTFGGDERRQPINSTSIISSVQTILSSTYLNNPPMPWLFHRYEFQAEYPTPISKA